MLRPYRVKRLQHFENKRNRLRRCFDKGRVKRPRHWLSTNVERMLRQMSRPFNRDLRNVPRRVMHVQNHCTVHSIGCFCLVTFSLSFSSLFTRSLGDFRSVQVDGYYRIPYLWVNGFNEARTSNNKQTILVNICM